MATYTSYLNLEKPTTSETFNLLKMNQNWDKIDAGVSALNSKLKGLMIEHFNVNDTTNSAGQITVPVSNTYRILPFIVTNVADTLATQYNVTVSTMDMNNHTLLIRVRKLSDGSAVTNEAVNMWVMILGY